MPNEYAWGTDRIPAANGPVPDDDGVAARASYWGILGLSDNMGERTVTVGNAVGRRFPGTHGDGALAEPASQHDLRDKRPPGWHGLSMVGIGHRGGSRCGGGCMSKMYQIYEDLRLRTSDRYWATSEHPSLLLHPRQQYFTSGFRFVRTAPRGRFPLSPGHLRRMVFLTGPASSMVLQSPNKQEPLIPLAH